MERIVFGYKKANSKRYLLIYDIASNRRRTKLAKILESYGARVQYSAFEFTLNSVKYKEMISQASKMADSEDSIRVYELDFDNCNTMYGVRKVDDANCDVIIV